MRLQFLGANRQVTGSSYLLEAGGLRLLIDCGLFQERAFLARNWNPFPVPPRGIDFLLLTHVHLDHSGLIPKLVKEGFSHPILTTSASAELLRIMLMDAARIHEEDAAYKKKRHKQEGRPSPQTEIPLYTAHEAEQCFSLLKEVDYHKPLSLNDHVSICFHDAGHILGSAMLELTLKENGTSKRLIFSGDIGQWNKPLVRDPSVFEKANHVIMESTYGDRNHDDPEDIETLLCRIINETVESGGNLVIPTFAVERAQELMFYLSRLVRAKCIPPLDIFLNSPMAADVTEVFLHHLNYLDEETQRLFQSNEQPFRFPGLKLVRTVEESKAIHLLKESCIIMAGSGMCTGGRVKHHLVHNISRPESTILFVGYQAKDTLGRQIVDRKPIVRIHGQFHPVQARVEQIHGFSGHADKQALLKWLSSFNSPPKHLFITHGEEDISLKFAEEIQEKEGWVVSVPEYLDEFELK